MFENMNDIYSTIQRHLNRISTQVKLEYARKQVIKCYSSKTKHGRNIRFKKA